MKCKTQKSNDAGTHGIKNDLLPELQIVLRRPSELKNSECKVRKIKSRHVERLTSSICKFGFTQPVLVQGSEIVDGHTRVEAARQLGLTPIPCIDVSHLNDGEVRLLRIALNKIQERGEWDEPALKLEFAYQLDIETDLSVTGFDAWEVDAVLEIGTDCEGADPLDDFGDMPHPDDVAITKMGDMYRLGDHLLVCGSARSEALIDLLTDKRSVRLVFTDPPFNVPIAGHVSSSGMHSEFAEAAGEMNPQEFEDFLTSVFGIAANHLCEGGLIYSFMDWRHMDEISSAIRRIGMKTIQLCVWAKDHPGMGSFYRSQHELVFVAKKPGSPHCNNIELGAHGRNRTNVWRFAGATGGQTDVVDNFKLHPTVKPVRLIEEVLLDVTGPGDFVLDPFLGSGSTLLAAERKCRRCLGVEISPAYVDVAIRRWQEMTGEQAVHVASGRTFAEQEMDLKGGDVALEDFQ